MILIAGPCVIESCDVLKETADVLADAIVGLDIEFFFKSSCIKDNRTQLSHYSGIGFDKGTELMQQTKSFYDFKICTDFHSIIDFNTWGDKYDLVQVPAYLSQQTSILSSAAATRKDVHLKKGQFLSPEQLSGPISKLKESGAKRIIVSDRGTSFGYDRLFMDSRHVKKIKQFGVEVLADISHPTKVSTSPPSGNWREAYDTGMSYIAAGADGLFFETHPDPEKALCDSNTMIPLSEAKQWILDFYRLYKFIHGEQK